MIIPAASEKNIPYASDVATKIFLDLLSIVSLAIVVNTVCSFSAIFFGDIDKYHIQLHQTT